MNELFRVLKVVLLTFFALGWLYLMSAIVWVFIKACIRALKAEKER
jgi:hypothetical protein